VAGIGNPTAMAGGIAEALITTAAGLLVAIPALFAYRYLRGRVDTLVIQMEKESIKLVQAIDRTSGTRRARSCRTPRREFPEAPHRGTRAEHDVADRRRAAAADLLHAVDALHRRGRLQLRLPEAGVEPEAVSRDAVEIEVTAEGGYRVNGRR